MKTKRFWFGALPLFLLFVGGGIGPDRDAQATVGAIPFDILRLFFEFNSTDDDLGVQLLLDAEAWNRLKIINPRGREILNITATGPLGRLGLTELFFESDEPSPEEVLDIFRAGDYRFEGLTVEGDELEGEATLSQRLPPRPVILFPSFAGQVVNRNNTIVRWQPISGIASFEIIVENEELGAEMIVPLPAGKTSLHVPVEFLARDTEYKVEVLAVGTNGNKTITEREFVTAP